MFLYETLHVCVCVCVCALVVVVVVCVCALVVVVVCVCALVVVVVCVCALVVVVVVVVCVHWWWWWCVCVCALVILYRLPATLSHALYCCLFLHIQLCKDLVRFLKAIGESTAIVFINVTVYTCTLYIILRLHIIIVLYM